MKCPYFGCDLEPVALIRWFGKVGAYCSTHAWILDAERGSCPEYDKSPVDGHLRDEYEMRIVLES